MGITPGEDPDGQEESPLLAEDPLPPDSDGVAEAVEEVDERIRSGGPDEVEEADKRADAAEGDAQDAQDRKGTGSPGSDADSDRDPTSDEGVDPEDPEAQRGQEPVIDAS